MATQSKSQFLTDIHAQLKRRYKPKPDRDAGKLTVLEAVVYGVCHEDTTREQANQALSRFKDHFFDWNEVRVSPIAEIQETLADIPDAEGRAQRIRRFLRQLFEKTYGFTLEALTKKPLKEALKVLNAYEAFTSDYVTATVIQQALGGHAIPVDTSTRRALERLGIADPDLTALRSVSSAPFPRIAASNSSNCSRNWLTTPASRAIPNAPAANSGRFAITCRRRSRKLSSLPRTKPAAAKTPAKPAAGPEKPAKKPAPEPAKSEARPAAKKPAPSKPPLHPSPPLASAAEASRNPSPAPGLV